MSDRRFDIAIVGAGIVGLAHALAAVKRGLRVVVLDRDDCSSGASIRNFGFITVTGQSEGAIWRRAMRTRDIWADLAEKAAIPIVHRNECVIAHSREALEVLEQFAETEMGASCSLLSPEQVLIRVPMAREASVTGGLWSPHELRIEPRMAIPALATYLESLGVVIRRGSHVHEVDTPMLRTSCGKLEAERVIVAPGPDLVTLYPEIFATHNVRLCKLHMLRLARQPWTLTAAIMSDFGLTRYPGFSKLSSAAALTAVLSRQDPEIVTYGIHLIVVQSLDGSLIVGDSHEYGMTHDPFFSSDVEMAMLRLAQCVLHVQNTNVVERWIGYYPQSPSGEWFVDAPDAYTRVVSVTAGNGMSTAFGLAEEVVDAMCG